MSMIALDQYYYLLQAYDALGRRLFGREWTGQDLLQPRIDPPEILAERRAPLEQKLKAIDARDDEGAAAMQRLMSEEERDRLKEEKAALFAERAELQQDLGRLPALNDDYRRSYDAYARSEKAKAMLFGALNSGSVKAQAGLGMLIDWPYWSRARRFRCDLDLSLVILPHTFSSRRRDSVLIRKDHFDAWLKTVTPLSPELIAQLEPEALCRAWLRELGQKHPDRSPFKKTAMRADAKRDFRVSANVFDRLWDDVVPVTWKRAGAPKGARKSAAQ